MSRGLSAAAPYAGLCLGFVKAAYADAGVSQSYFDQASAKDGCDIAKTKAGWTTGGTPPLGQCAPIFGVCPPCIAIGFITVCNLIFEAVIECPMPVAASLFCADCVVNVRRALSPALTLFHFVPFLHIVGAVIFWENCSAYGHVAISRGGGMVSACDTSFYPLLPPHRMICNHVCMLLTGKLVR